MNIGRIAKMALAAAVVYVVVDYIALNYLLSGAMASMAAILNPTPPAMSMWAAVDVVAAIVLVVVYDRVRGSFAAGAAGGATFGVYAGLFTHLPTWIGLHLFLKDFSYTSAWLFTAEGVVASVLMGAAAGAVAGSDPAAA